MDKYSGLTGPNNTYIYIYIYIYIYFIEHNRHFLSPYFFVDLFILPYWFYNVWRELVDVSSIIIYFPNTFCPTLGHHQGRIYYKGKDLLQKCPWCNGYRHRKWTQWHEFKSWTRLIIFYIALIPLGKVWIQLFSLQLWVNSRADWVLQPW